MPNVEGGGGGGEHHGQRNSTKFGNPGVGLGLCINVILVLFVNEVVPRSPSTGVLSWIQMKQESIDCSRQPICTECSGLLLPTVIPPPTPDTNSVSSLTISIIT